MAQIDQSRIAELKLAVGTSNLNDAVDLADWSLGNNDARVSVLVEQYDIQGQTVLRGMSIDWIASGKASTTGEKAQLRQITIPLFIAPDSPLGDSAGAGDVLIAAEQAIIKKARQIAAGSGADAIANSVWLWMRYVNNSNYVYWACQAATWQPVLPKTIAQQVLLGILTLTCLPYPFGDPILDPVSVTLSATSPSVYKSGIPGDHAGATRIYLMDQSGGGKIAQRWTLASRTLDGLAAGDWKPGYGITAVSPATQTSDSAAYGGTRASLTTSNAWQNVGYFQSGSGAFESQEALARLRVRDGTAPLGAPSGLSGSTALVSGGLPTAQYTYWLQEYDSSAHVGELALLSVLNVNNAFASGALATPVNLLDYEDFESQLWTLWQSSPVTSPAGAGSVAITIDNVAPITGSYSGHFKAVSDTVAGVLNNGNVTRSLPALPTSKIDGDGFWLVPVSWSSAVLAAPSAPTFVSSSTSGGTLSNGTYKVYCTCYNAYGETAAASPLSVVLSGGGSSQSFTITPPSLPSGATAIVYYVTVAGGSTGFFFTSSAGSGNFAISSVPSAANRQPPSINTATLDQAARWTFAPNLGQVVTVRPSGVAGMFQAWCGTPAYAGNRSDTPFPGSNVLGSPFSLGAAATTVSGAQTLPEGTLTVASTTGFASSGFLNVGKQIVAYTGKTSTTFTGCTGGAGAIANGASVRQAHRLQFNFDASGTLQWVRLYVDGVLIGQNSTSLPSTIVAPTQIQFQVQAYGQSPAVTEEWYVDQYFATDQFQDTLTTIQGGGANTLGWTLGQNAAGSKLIWAADNGEYYVLDQGAATSYTHSLQLPPNAIPLGALPGAVPPVQPSLVRVGVGVSLAEAQAHAANAPAYPCLVSNNEWEIQDHNHKPLPNTVIPEGQTAPPWFAAVQVMNPGSATPLTFDCDELIPIPKDSGSSAVQVECPLTLARPALLQLDTRRDDRVSALWYDTGTLTTSGDIVTDVTRLAATLDDGATVPGGWGIYPTGTGLTHGTVSTQARTQAPFSLLGTATQGGFAAAYVPKDTSSFHWLFSVSNGTEHECIECYYDGSNFVLNREHSSTAHQVSVAYAVAAGTMVEVCGYWTATQIGLSVNGSTFVTLAASAIPTGLGTNFDLWSKDNYATGGEIDGRGIWFVGMAGTPSVADAAGLYPVTPAVGLPVGLPVGAAPTLDQFSAAAGVTFLWDCRTSRYGTSTLLTAGVGNGELKLGPNTAIYAAYPEYVDANGAYYSDVADAEWTMRTRIMPAQEFLRGAT